MFKATKFPWPESKLYWQIFLLRLRRHTWSPFLSLWWAIYHIEVCTRDAESSGSHLSPLHTTYNCIERIRFSSESCRRESRPWSLEGFSAVRLCERKSRSKGLKAEKRAAQCLKNWRDPSRGVEEETIVNGTSRMTSRERRPSCRPFAAQGS